MASSEIEIGDEEIVYRRIPLSMKWYDPISNELDSNAFKPHRLRDMDGLSVNRAPSVINADFLTPETLCKTNNPKRVFYIAVLNVSDLKEHGIQVVANPIKGNSGHALIPDINSKNRKSDSVREWTQLLAVSLVHNVLGPYPA